MADKENGDKAPTKDEMNELRSQLDKKVADADKRAAAADSRASQAESRVVSTEFDVDLSESEEGLSSEERSKLTGALQKGKEAQSNLNQIVPMLVEQQAKALAYELALEHDASADVNDIKGRIKAGGTPVKMEAIAKEISLEYKEKKIDAKAKGDGDDNNDADDSGSTRKFAQGGGKGSVNPNKFLTDVDDVDMESPDAQKEMDKLYEQLAAR